MIEIRLLLQLSYHHFSIPAGTVIAVPAGIARMAIERGIAEPAGPEHAVVEPEEKRTNQYATRKRNAPGTRYGSGQ